MENATISGKLSADVISGGAITASSIHLGKK
jgi:hypothetical protein